MKQYLPPLLILLIMLPACKRDIQNEEAVRQGIMNYLAKRSDLSSMDVTVKNVAFRQNEADATVHFQAKNTTAPGAGLEMNYVLERKGNDWVVKGKGIGAGHGAGQMPGSLPPGHPPIPPAGGQLATPPAGPAR